MNDSLGDRMKHQYENRTRYFLPRRTYTILRVDGKSFHTFTKNCDRPWDNKLVEAMNHAAIDLCKWTQGSCFAYVQSDEISILLTDFAQDKTEAYFDGNLQKIVSVSASLVTATFNDWYHHLHKSIQTHNALFDCRAFTIPDPTEVKNYFIWRQQDATRNSISSLAQAHFSTKQLHGLSSNQMQERLHKVKGVNWNNLPTEQKRGRIIYDDMARGEWSVENRIPVFTQDWSFLDNLVPEYT